MKAAKTGDLQDGMLAHYLSQARASDVNVESRLDREPFDYQEILRQKSPRVRRVREFPWPPKA